MLSILSASRLEYAFANSSTVSSSFSASSDAAPVLFSFTVTGGVTSTTADLPSVNGRSGTASAAGSTHQLFTPPYASSYNSTASTKWLYNSSGATTLTCSGATTYQTTQSFDTDGNSHIAHNEFETTNPENTSSTAFSVLTSAGQTTTAITATYSASSTSTTALNTTYPKTFSFTYTQTRNSGTSTATLTLTSTDVANFTTATSKTSTHSTTSAYSYTTATTASGITYRNRDRLVQNTLIYPNNNDTAPREIAWAAIQRVETTEQTGDLDALGFSETTPFTISATDWFRSSAGAMGTVTRSDTSVSPFQTVTFDFTEFTYTFVSSISTGTELDGGTAHQFWLATNTLSPSTRVTTASTTASSTSALPSSTTHTKQFASAVTATSTCLSQLTRTTTTTGTFGDNALRAEEVAWTRGKRTSSTTSTVFASTTCTTMSEDSAYARLSSVFEIGTSRTEVGAGGFTNWAIQQDKFAVAGAAAHTFYTPIHAQGFIPFGTAGDHSVVYRDIVAQMPPAFSGVSFRLSAVRSMVGRSQVSGLITRPETFSLECRTTAATVATSSYLQATGVMLDTDNDGVINGTAATFGVTLVKGIVSTDGSRIPTTTSTGNISVSLSAMSASGALTGHTVNAVAYGGRPAFSSPETRVAGSGYRRATTIFSDGGSASATTARSTTEASVLATSEIVKESGLPIYSVGPTAAFLSTVVTTPLYPHTASAMTYPA